MQGRKVLGPWSWMAGLPKRCTASVFLGGKLRASPSRQQRVCFWRGSHQHDWIIQCCSWKSQAGRLLFPQPPTSAALSQRSCLSMEQPRLVRSEPKQIAKDCDETKTNFRATGDPAWSRSRNSTSENHSWGCRYTPTFVLWIEPIILPGVEIGKKCIVGAGAVVTKSFLADGSVIAGNPARLIKKV